MLCLNLYPLYVMYVDTVPGQSLTCQIPLLIFLFSHIFFLCLFYIKLRNEMKTNINIDCEKQRSALCMLTQSELKFFNIFTFHHISEQSKWTRQGSYLKRKCGAFFLTFLYWFHFGWKFKRNANHTRSIILYYLMIYRNHYTLNELE